MADPDVMVLAGATLVYLERQTAYQKELTMPRSALPRSENQQAKLDIMKNELTESEKTMLLLILKARPDMRIRVNEICQVGYFVGDIDLDDVDVAPGKIGPVE
jgi:hypothetical protein